MRPGRILKASALGLLILVTLVFAFFKSHDLILGIRISIDSPSNGQTLSEPFVSIRGEARGNTLLTINGAKVLTDAEGKFEKELLLGLGYNVIEIKALDRFNRENKEVLELVYKPRDETNEDVALNN